MACEKRSLYDCIQKYLNILFFKYGKFVGRHPVAFIVGPIVVCGLLGLGLLRIESETDVEALYTPMNSRASRDRIRVNTLFPDTTEESYNMYNLNDADLYGQVIFHANDIVLREDVLNEIKTIVEIIQNFKIENTEINFDKVCARNNASCVIDGNFFFGPSFLDAMNKSEISFPVWKSTAFGNVDLSGNLAGVKTSNNTLISAAVMKITFHLRQVKESKKQLSLLWENSFLKQMQKLKGNITELAYATSQSLGKELNANTDGDVKFFSITFTLMIFYATLIAGGDCVSSRGHLARAGVIAAGLGILGSFGLLSLCGVKFVNIVGVMPFLVLGVGVDDMFLIMSSWAEARENERLNTPDRVADAETHLGKATINSERLENAENGLCKTSNALHDDGDEEISSTKKSDTVVRDGVTGTYPDGTTRNRINSGNTANMNIETDISNKVGATFRLAGLGITMTSLTDVLAFCIGATSVFLSVRNFCVYAGVAILFCYLCQATLFAGCLVIHGRRVAESRHCVTCKPVKAKQTMIDDGKPRLQVCCCSGSAPFSREDDQSIFEKIPGLVLPKILLLTPVKIFVILLFLGYLGMSIWGVTRLEQGLVLKNLVPPSSYYHRFSIWDNDYFGVRFPVSLVFDGNLDYSNDKTIKDIHKLLDDIRADTDIRSDTSICWLSEYMNSIYFDNSSSSAFISALNEKFLPFRPEFKSDITFDGQNQSIEASRCYVFSQNIRSSSLQGKLMNRIRDIADSSPLPCFPYYPNFIYFEQYISILPSTLQTVGIAVAVMFCITCLLMPHPLMIVLIVVNILTILLGIFGFMYFWELTLSSITMIHLIMSVGFSVDYSVHVCTAFMIAKGNRTSRAKSAIVHAAGPILNGGISSFVGIIVLIASESYVFQSFFKIMLFVIIFGVAHAVIVMPVVLSVIGPSLDSSESLEFSKTNNSVVKVTEDDGIYIVSAQPVRQN